MRIRISGPWNLFIVTGLVGAVWLGAEQLAPYDYWQFWRNAADADVGKFLRLFTDLPLDEIARLEALQGAEINDAKIVLATEAAALLHGRKAAEAAAATAQARTRPVASPCCPASQPCLP